MNAKLAKRLRRETFGDYAYEWGYLPSGRSRHADERRKTYQAAKRNVNLNRRAKYHASFQPPALLKGEVKIVEGKRIKKKNRYVPNQAFTQKAIRNYRVALELRMEDMGL